MNSNQINTSGNGSIVAISLAVITSVTTVVTTIVNKDDNTNKKPEVVASTVVTPPAPVPTVYSLQNQINLLKEKNKVIEKDLNECKTNHTFTDYKFHGLLFSLDEETRKRFNGLVQVSSNLKEGFEKLLPTSK